MIKKIRYTIYFIIFIFIIFMFLGKAGVYDLSIIKVDDFIFKKPFLYRTTIKKSEIKLKNQDFSSFMFLSLFRNSGAYYQIDKTIDKDKFIFKLKYNYKLNDINIRNCYILNSNLKIDSQTIVKQFEIFSYPYIISFNEINEEREKTMIEQICGTSKIINLEIPSEN